MPNVLITGSSGFVGRQTRRAFDEAGWHTVGIARRPTDQADYLQCDLSQPLSQKVQEAIRRSDVVLHAAARSSPWGRRQQFHAANVTATENIVRACESLGRPKLIFISSSSVFYRPLDQFDIKESTPFPDQAVNDYAATKQLGEQIVQNYSGKWVVLRPRAVYGKGDTVLFPRILTAAKAGKLPLLIRKGTPTVGDLISIDNLTDMLVQAATDSQIVGDFNLTDNDPKEIIAFLLDVFQRLNIPKPSREVSVDSAFRIARLIEWLYGIVTPWREPPITRFGVHVFAYSKTFDVSKMLQAFGNPKTPTELAVQRFISWVEAEDPYQLN